MFETPRLRLRGYRSSDEEFFVSLLNTYDVALYLKPTYVAPLTRECVLYLVDRLGKTALFVVAESKEMGVPIGFCNVAIKLPLTQDGVFGIVIAKEWWGQGFGTEITTWTISYSFKSLGLRRLSLNVMAANHGAVSLYEHVGFKHEGRKREAFWKEGKWDDYLSMGLLAKEYYGTEDSGSSAYSGGSVLPMPLTPQGTQDTETSDWIVL